MAVSECPNFNGYFLILDEVFFLQILAGDLATQFAVEMGFKEESLSTTESKQMWTDWRNNQCQPNFWFNVSPDHNSNCGPYTPIHPNEIPTTQLPGRLFSPSNICKKLSHHFLLHFPIVMGSYVHHAKYQGVFP